MTDGGKYHPPLLFLLFSFCSQYKSKKISPGMTFWILCTKMQVCTRFGSWRPPCIFQNLFIIIILMQMIISQTKDFAQTNGYLSNKRRAQSRRGDHWSPAQTHRSSVGMKVDINPRSGRPMVAPTKVVRGSYSNERLSLKRTTSLNPVGATSLRRRSPAQTHRSNVGMKVDINPRSGRPMVAPTKVVRRPQDYT